jgi:flagellar motor switch/type III secretory pathway protein FliN
MTTGLALPPAEEVSEAAWQKVQDVRCGLTAELSVRGFTVRDLLLLQNGSLVSTKQPTRARISVRANGSFMALAEFEVFGTHLGIRLTEVG